MKKDLKELAKKYDSLTDLKQINIEAKAQRIISDKWLAEKPDEFSSLFSCRWFHFENLGVKIGGDDRLKMKEGLLSRIPEEVTQGKLLTASDYIYDYFTLVTKYIENPDQVEPENPIDDTLDGWGEDEFLLGLLGQRRGEGPGLFSD